jgi:DNA-nicking Smr family endonuclease
MAKQRSAKPSAAPAPGGAARTPAAAQIPPADVHAFREAVRDVIPLTHTPKPEGLEARKPRPRMRRPAATHEDLDELMPLLATDAPMGVSESAGDSAGDALAFHRAGVRTQVMRRLRRGLFPTESELDLHGLSQAAARARLADFIAGCRGAGYRCVRIIHGKGYRSGPRGPVLKTAVNLWLRRHMDVMAFTSAKAIDGGTGALYVLLRA